MASLDRTARQIFFVEFIKSFALTMRYFFLDLKTCHEEEQPAHVQEPAHRRLIPDAV